MLRDTAKLLQLNEIKSVDSSLIVLDLEINGVILKTLIDSGATYNYMSKKALDHTALSDQESLFHSATHNVVVANEAVLTSLGSVQLSGHLDEHPVQTNFTVMENLTFDVILGMAFLREHRVIIDAEESEIYYKSPTPTLNVKIVEDITIPAFSNMVVPVFIPEPLLTCQVVNSDPGMIKKGVFAAKGLVDVKTSNFNIFLSNLTDKEKSLNAFTTVGFLTPIEDYTVSDPHILNGFFDDHPLKDSRIIIDQNVNNLNTNETRTEGLLETLDLNASELTNDQSQKLKQTILEYSDIFSANYPGATDLVTHRIDVGDNRSESVV